MKCQACGYVSFDKLTFCKKCGADMHGQEAQDRFVLFKEEQESRASAAATELDEQHRGDKKHGLAQDEPKEATAPAKKTLTRGDVQKEGASATVKKTMADSILSDVWYWGDATQRVAGDLKAEPPQDFVKNIHENEEVFEDLPEYRIDLEPEEEIKFSIPAEPGTQMTLLAEEAPPLRTVAEVPTIFLGELPAGLTTRGLAILVDVALFGSAIMFHVAAAGVGLALKGIPIRWLITTAWPLDGLFPLFLLTLMVSGVYFVYYHWRSGRTPGKRMLSIRVVSEERCAISFNQSLLRWMSYFISLAPGGLGFLWALTNVERRTWHDRLSGTMVVNDPN